MKVFHALALLAMGATAASRPRTTPASPPKTFAVALFPSFDPIDVYGPLNPLWYLSFSRQLNLYLLSDTLEPVWIQPALPSLNRQNSSFWSSINPTHTYATAPHDIDVLIVPGGAGARFLNVSSTVAFIADRYPKLQYLITVCTGAGVAARAGVLDGKRATTNKKAWKETTALGPRVDWKSPARWIRDGNVWSSSGVTAGLDLIFAFIEEMYGKEVADGLDSTIEYKRGGGMCDDPFATINGVAPTWECVES